MHTCKYIHDAECCQCTECDRGMRRGGHVRSRRNTSGNHNNLMCRWNCKYLQYMQFCLTRILDFPKLSVCLLPTYHLHG